MFGSPGDKQSVVRDGMVATVIHRLAAAFTLAADGGELEAVVDARSDHRLAVLGVCGSAVFDRVTERVGQFLGDVVAADQVRPGLPVRSPGVCSTIAAVAAASRASIMPTWPSPAEIRNPPACLIIGARVRRFCRYAFARSSV
jgi:hypothetical protein